MSINDLLNLTIEKKASDLHIIVNYPATLRVNGNLIPVDNNPIPPGEITQLLINLLTDKQKNEFELNKEIDFGIDFEDFRFRVNFYNVRGNIAASFRLINSNISSLETLSLPTTFYNFANLKQGLVLLTGPTGEGKSTTIAAIINEINKKSSRHILTIEDPIEYLYPKGKSIVSQREIGKDTNAWNVALKSALREDPDVVLIGEMRDLETIAAALTIAETGHLVFSTLHTNSSPQTIDRIVDVFPSRQQNQVRLQLASVLRAIITQRLIPNKADGKLIPACEILLNNSAVSAVIREGKTFLIDQILETSASEGMMMLEKYLAMLYRNNQITKETAYYYAIRQTQISKLIE